MRQLEEITLELDEVEALRLVEAEGMEQTAAAVKMGISQSTIQRILAGARQKVARAIIGGQALRIETTKNNK